ncbi:MAG: hypothetical protein AB8G05_19330 [Oligoflexales bacterium]
MKSKIPEEKWKELLADWQQSSETRKVFCEKHNIKPHQLSHQLAKQKNRTKTPKTPSFVPIAQKIPKKSLELRIGTNIVLGLDSACDPIWLANLLKLLAGT